MSENIIRLVVSKSKAAMSLYYFMIQVSNLIYLAYHRTVPRHPRFPSLSPLCHSTHAGLLCCCGSIGRHRRRARVVMFTTVYDRGLDQREEETTSPPGKLLLPTLERRETHLAAALPTATGVFSTATAGLAALETIGRQEGETRSVVR